MKTDITIQTYPLFIGMGLSVILLLSWIIRRRIKKAKIESVEKTKKYSKHQKIGIVIILLFILPFSLITMSYLTRGILFLWVIPINLLSKHPLLHLPLQTLAITVAYFIYFAGPYYMCELLWPTKKIGNESNVFM